MIPPVRLDGTGTVSTGRIIIRTVDRGVVSIDYPTIEFSAGSTVAYPTVTLDNCVTGNTIDTGTAFVFDFVPDRPVSRRSRTSVRRNHRGMVPRAVSVDFSHATPGEITALQLLRRLVGQDEFRRYLKYGFVTVRGCSGLRYHIRRCRHVVDVWNDRRRIDGICVYLRGSYPPTDETITRMLMAERDELALWRRGNSRLGRNVTVEQLCRAYRGDVLAA